jgi:hypothetical protein
MRNKVAMHYNRGPKAHLFFLASECVRSFSFFENSFVMCRCEPTTFLGIFGAVVAIRSMDQCAREDMQYLALSFV